MNKYGLTGKFTAQAGKRDEFISILLKASKLMSTAKGCHIYIVSKDEKNENDIHVFEAWDSKEDHDNSLQIEGCKELITKAMPLIDGKSEGFPLEIMGGKGLYF